MEYMDNTPKWIKRHNKPVKSVSVRELKNHINKLLENPSFTQDEKRVMCSTLQDVLFATKQYNGFNYTKWIHGGFEQWRKDGQPEDNKPYLGQEYDRYYY